MTKTDLEVLQKIISACLDEQTYSLSKMLSEPLHSRLLEIVELEFSDVEKRVSHAGEDEICAVYVKCKGDLQAGFIFYLPVNQASDIASKLTGQGKEAKFSGIKGSSLLEIGNVMAGTFLNSLSHKTGLRLQPFPPALSIDMIGTLLETPVSDIASSTNSVIVVQSAISASGNQTLFHNLLIFTPQGVRKVLASNKR